MRLFLKIIKDMEIFLYGNNQQKTQKQHMGQPLGNPPRRSWAEQTQPARDTQRGYGYDVAKPLFVYSELLTHCAVG